MSARTNGAGRTKRPSFAAALEPRSAKTQFRAPQPTAPEVVLLHRAWPKLPLGEIARPSRVVAPQSWQGYPDTGGPTVAGLASRTVRESHGISRAAGSDLAVKVLAATQAWCFLLSLQRES